MTTYTVTRVRKELSADRTHRHLEGVITDTGMNYTRQQVVDSLHAGHTWRTSAGGHTAIIRKLRYCPRAACTATPYIVTNPNSSLADNLENLPEG